MLRFRPSFSTLLVFFGLALVLWEVVWLDRARRAAGRAVIAWERKIREQDQLLRQEPAPTAAAEAAIAEQIAAGLGARKQFQAVLASPPDDPAAAVPNTSLDAFFQIAAFVEQARSQARRSHVTVRGDACFGFASHANAGPPASLLATVHRQHRAAAMVLDALWGAEPTQLLALRRERAIAGDGGARDDFFVLEPGLSLRAPGTVETTAVAVEFVGPTSVLRRFLANLAQAPQPTSVRSVGAELADEDDLGGSGADQPAPLVRGGRSKFIVQVEVITTPAWSASLP